jgi:RND superfamily putative drug exporter
MELLGARNWWMPGWLDRLLPHLNAGGHDAPSRDEAGAPKPAQAPTPIPRPQTVDA